MTKCKVVLLFFSTKEGCFALSMCPEKYPPLKDYEQNCLQVSILDYVSVLCSYVCDHAASLRISANEPFFARTQVLSIR